MCKKEFWQNMKINKRVNYVVEFKIVSVLAENAWLHFS